MKKFVMLLTLALSVSAFAQDAERVELNAENVFVNSDQAVLVRTSQTPDTVKVTFQIPMAERVCDRYAERDVLITSSLQCGQDRFVQRVRLPDVCTRRNPHNNQCLRTEQRFDDRVTYRARSCYVLQTYCAQYGTSVQTSPDEVKIKFKLADLAQGEEETFMVKAQQKNYDGTNVVYEISGLETKVPVKVKSKGWFGTDSYVIDEE